MAKAHISDRKKLAAALRCLKVEVDGVLVEAIPYDDAKKMTAEQVISLFHFDHGIPESIDGPTEHWNLTPRFIAKHRRKTAKTDLPQIAKTKRIETQHAAFKTRVLAKTGQTLAEDVDKISSNRTRVLRSRGFPKRPGGQKARIPSRPMRTR